ncbi:phage tail length tape measure family protein [Nonlabens sp. SCSIO 43208]|uniref:phage tail length tape measure family protein n=1 Tax=Nonlabens sp. SCSIO 43208 TaxID=2793009 RepID=UPI003D6AE514
MASLAQINIKFAADLKQFSTQMQNAQRSITKMGRKLQSVGKGLSIGVTAPIVALGTASVIAFDKQAKAIAQVEAGLKSTGNAANKTSEQLQAMASQLQNTSLFGDEEILKDVTAQLLTFTNIAGAQFDRTQQAALDLATRLDGDLKSASIQLGKALNDPIANLSALSRSGIQFSNEQKALIKSLVETNRLADAQTIILDELEKQYGGAAQAAARAGTGPLKQLQNTLGDLSEQFGEIISEAILPLVDYLKNLADRFSKLDKSTKKTIVVIAALAAAVGPLLVTLGFMMTSVIPGLITSFTTLTTVISANPFGAAAVAVGLLLSAFIALNAGTKEVIVQQSALAEVRKQAADSIAKERANLERLLIVARDEKVSKEQRLKAIKEINAISPKYLGDLTLETINTNKAKDAIEAYNEALLQTARVKAAQQKLVEIEKKIINTEVSSAQTRVDIAKLTEQQFRLQNDARKTNIDLVNEQKKAVETFDKVIEAGTASLVKQRNALIEIIREGEKFSLGNEKATKTVKDLTSAVNDFDPKKLKIQAPEIIVPEIQRPNADAPLELVTQEDVDVFDERLAQMQANAAQFAEELAPIMETAAEGFAVGFGQLLGQAAQGGNFLQGFFTLFVDTLATVAIQVGKTAIGIGIAVDGIKAALKSLSGPVAIAAGVALVALGTLAKSALSSIADGGPTPFANGGIVSGPVNALVGEYAGARNNPEVIAPLDKLQRLLGPMGGGTTVIEGEFVLRGNDLVRVIKRQENRDSRTR